MVMRHRTNLVGNLARMKNRVQKILEDGSVKWGSDEAKKALWNCLTKEYFFMIRACCN